MSHSNAVSLPTRHKLTLGQDPFALCTDAQGAPQRLISTQGDLN